MSERTLFSIGTNRYNSSSFGGHKLKLKKRSLQRLASLSAVGAGAVFVTADQAEASAIVYSGPLNISLGWPNPGGTGGSYSQTLGGGNAFQFKGHAFTHVRGSNIQFGRSVYATGRGSLGFARTSRLLLPLFSAGQTWGGAPAGLGLEVIGRTFGTSGANTFYGSARGDFSHQYALFRFNPGAGMLYGWVELSGSVTAANSSLPSFGPSLTIEGWAYDTTGAPIHAGDTGSAVPEPGTFAGTGLAALALGAAGMRRWRAARRLA